MTAIGLVESRTITFLIVQFINYSGIFITYSNFIRLITGGRKNDVSP